MNFDKAFSTIVSTVAGAHLATAAIGTAKYGTVTPVLVCWFIGFALLVAGYKS